MSPFHSPAGWETTPSGFPVLPHSFPRSWGTLGLGNSQLHTPISCSPHSKAGIQELCARN